MSANDFHCGSVPVAFADFARKRSRDRILFAGDNLFAPGAGRHKCEHALHRSRSLGRACQGRWRASVPGPTRDCVWHRSSSGDGIRAAAIRAAFSPGARRCNRQKRPERPGGPDRTHEIFPSFREQLRQSNQIAAYWGRPSMPLRKAEIIRSIHWGAFRPVHWSQSNPARQRKQ